MNRHRARCYATAVIAYSVLCAFPTADATAHSVKQKLGSYIDSRHVTRRSVSYDFGLDGPGRGEQLTSTNYTLSVSREIYQKSDIDEDEFSREVYEGGTRTNDQFAVSANQTWNRTADTRIVAAFADDGLISSRTYGTGVSQWFHHETLRLSFDASRTLTQQPDFAVLDYDSELVGTPTAISSSGFTAALRHLATPTTMLDYQLGHIVTTGRPPSNSAGLGVRQFITATRSAVHATVARAYNRGTISTRTTYGQVDAWEGRAFYLQHLWRGARSSLGYRYYQENETTRAYEDERVLGSDTISVGLTQELPKNAIDGMRAPLTIETAGARYFNNDNQSATSYELGLAPRFRGEHAKN